MKKLMIILAPGFEEVEALSVVDILRRASVTADMISISGEYVTSSNNITVQTDFPIDTIDEDQYDGLVLPGGMPGAENLKNNAVVIDIVKKFFKEEKLVCAICAAPMVLGEADVVKDKDITCYPGFEQYLNGANIKSELVVICGNIITGKGPAAAFEFAFTILENLGLKDEVEKLKSSMMF